MTLLINDDQIAIITMAKQFSQERLLPYYQTLDSHNTQPPIALVRELGQLGLIAPGNSKQYGGINLDSPTVGLILEALAQGDCNIAYISLIGSLMSQLLSKYASPKLTEQWVPDIVNGSAIVGIALTEPGSGSDAANLTLKANAVNGGFLLSGEKTSISLAHCANGFITFARTGAKNSGAKGVSAFLVEADSQGLSKTKINDLGGKVIGRGSLFYDDVFVPKENMLGYEGEAFTKIMQGFDFTRALIGLQCCGAAQRSLQETWDYVKQRKSFGKTIGKNQGVSFPLAEAEGRIEAVRQLCLHTLRLRDAGLPHTAEAAMCKWMAPETAVNVIHRCLITHGHYGWSLDLPHQQRLRDIMGLEIGDGTEQIMKIIIARERGGV